MIAQRFAVECARQHTSPPSITININLPERLTEGLMQLLATWTGQQTLPFPDNLTATETHGDRIAVSEPRHSAAPSQPRSPASSPASGTLLDAYRSRMKTRRQRTAGAHTIGDHEGSMKAFDAFFESSQTLLRFCTPVLSLAETDVLRLFSEHLIDSGLAPTTVNRRLTHMAMIAKELDLKVTKPTPDEVKRYAMSREASPRPAADPQHPQHQPRKSQRNADDGRRIPSFAEIDAMARHVSSVRYPYGDHAPYFWRGWIRFLAFIGPRSRDIVSTVTRKPGLRKTDVIFETLCPIADVNNALGYELHSPHGWMWYTIGKDHHSDCRRILFPMPKWMRDWSRFFCELSADPEKVFPSCQPRSKALSQLPLTAAWNAIVQAAGVDRRLVPSEGTGGRIALRKYASNWWHLATLRAKSDSSLADKMSHYVLHHAEVTTANKHYLNVQAAVLPTMLELMDTWPLPAADAPPVSMLPE